MPIKNKKNKPSWVDVKKNVNCFEKKQLVDLVGDLYHLSSDNKDFFHVRFSIGDEPLKSYKQIIQHAMHPYLEGHEELDLDRADDAIEKYSKAIDNPGGEAELMIFYVECGNNFTLSYGYIDEEIYDSLISMYEKAIETVIEMPESEQKPFKKRLYEITTSASGIGWGYSDELDRLFYSSFPQDK
ncbi:DUF6155 family protein [Desulfobacterales bacterium HSG16]|nr:DUF6155 family protein [Desulfobacterales bacterium HSG16]